MSDTEDREEGSNGERPQPTSGDPQPTAELPVAGPPTPPSPYAVPPPSVDVAPASQPVARHGYPGHPYGQPPYQQYGQPPYPPYGPPPPYGQPPAYRQEYGAAPGYAQYGIPPYAPPPSGYPPPPAQNGGAIALTVVSGLATVLCCIFSVPALVLGIMALTKQSTDPEQSRRLTGYGWIALGVSVALAVLAVVLLFAVGASSGFDEGSYDYGDI